MKAILLDWDGVIVDSTEMYFDLYKQMCERFHKNLPISTIEEFRQWYNPIWEQNYYEMGFTAQDIKKIIEYTAGIVDYRPIKVFPGIKEALANLSRDYPIAMVSTTPAATIRARLEQDHLEGYITHITGGDDGISEKIHKVANTLSLLNCDSGVMVGDTPLDISSGQANDLYTIGTTYGWVCPERIHAAKPSAVINHSTELEPTIRRLFAEVEE